MKFAMPAVSVGWIIALIILVAVFVLWLMGRMDAQSALLYGGLALARLL